MEQNTAQQQVNVTPPPTPPGYGQAQAKQLETPPIVKPYRDLYNVSYGGLIFRNFLAGASKTFGGILMYILFITVVGQLFRVYVWPELQPLMSTFETLGKLSASQQQPGFPSTTIQVDPNLIKQFVQEPMQPQDPVVAE